MPQKESNDDFQREDIRLEENEEINIVNNVNQENERNYQRSLFKLV
jgi:hypothetical protein